MWGTWPCFWKSICCFYFDASCYLCGWVWHTSRNTQICKDLFSFVMITKWQTVPYLSRLVRQPLHNSLNLDDKPCLSRQNNDTSCSILKVQHPFGSCRIGYPMMGKLLWLVEIPHVGCALPAVYFSYLPKWNTSGIILRIGRGLRKTFLEIVRNTEYTVYSEGMKMFKPFGLSKKYRSRNSIKDS